MTSKVISIVLGGGQGSRLAPLTQTRSKPAVPIAGKYRLVDIPISNCLHSNISRIFVLTQFNSASLNKHIKNTYHFSTFSTAFVDILAAEQTPTSGGWFQGTADAEIFSMPARLGMPRTKRCTLFLHGDSPCRSAGHHEMVFDFVKNRLGQRIADLRT